MNTLIQINNLMLKQLLNMTMSPHLKCAAAGVTRSRAVLRTSAFPLTPCVSSWALWWMNLIFLSTSDYFYVYLDIFLMGFHLSGTEWTGQEGRAGERERGSQSKRDKEAGGQWGNGNERGRVARWLQKVFKEICSECYCSAETSESSRRTLEFTPRLDLHGISVTFTVSSRRSGEGNTLHFWAASAARLSRSMHSRESSHFLRVIPWYLLIAVSYLTSSTPQHHPGEI